MTLQHREGGWYELVHQPEGLEKTSCLHVQVRSSEPPSLIPVISVHITPPNNFSVCLVSSVHLFFHSNVIQKVSTTCCTLVAPSTYQKTFSSSFHTMNKSIQHALSILCKIALTKSLKSDSLGKQRTILLSQKRNRRIKTSDIFLEHFYW